MPAQAPTATVDSAAELGLVAHRIRAHRKALGISTVAAAEAAGVSRVTLHRIERGEPSVTMGAYLNVLAALGLGLALTPQQAEAGRALPAAQAEPEADLPAEIRLADYPQLQRIAWSIPGASSVTPREALGLYERQWRHVDRAAMPAAERALLAQLVRVLGHGQLLV